MGTSTAAATATAAWKLLWQLLLGGGGFTGGGGTARTPSPAPGKIDLAVMAKRAESARKWSRLAMAKRAGTPGRTGAKDFCQDGYGQVVGATH